MAIGHDPNTALFKGQLDLEDNGYVRTFDGSTRTSVDGVFACGDVQDRLLPPGRSPPPARAAWPRIDAERWLEAHGER